MVVLRHLPGVRGGNTQIYTGTMPHGGGAAAGRKLMRILFTYDKRDYTPDMEAFEKHSVRAVIRQNGRLAAQKGARGDYKLLGGGMEEGENFAQALSREVREESGLVVKPESIREIGETVERRRDIFQPDWIYICHSYFFFCDVEEEMQETCMTESEIAKGFHLEWAAPEEIIEGNAPFLNEAWIARDTEFVRRLPEFEGAGNKVKTK